VLLGSNWLEPGELGAQLMHTLEPLAHRQCPVAFSASRGRCLMPGGFLTFIDGSGVVSHGTSVNGHGYLFRNLVCNKARRRCPAR
jgi:hypothetical protein